jgi:hypothetical protein
MLSGPSTPFVAGAQSLLVATVLLLLGYLLSEALFDRRRFKWWVPVALALPALVVYVFVLELIHIVLGGALFATPWAVRSVVLLTFGALTVRRIAHNRSVQDAPRPGVRPSKSELFVLASLTLMAISIWCLPVMRLLPLHQLSDINFHMGWAAQLQNGETTPSAAVTGEIPNAYPWLFHALTAFLASLTPDGNVFHTQGPLQVLLVAGSVFGFYGLGRELANKWTALSSALLGAICGGFGFLMSGGPDLVFQPLQAKHLFMGDFLFVRPYNAAAHNLSPAFPRDVSVVLLVGCLLLLVLGVKQRRFTLLIAAGVLIGCMGNLHPDAVFVALMLAVLTSLFSRHMGIVRSALAILLPALAVWAVWLLPLLITRTRYGWHDFAGRPLELPFLPILAAWGITTPLALYGMARWLPPTRKSLKARIPAAALLAAVAVLVIAELLPRFIGPGSTTLGYRKRYWSLLHLAIVVYAALGLGDLLLRLWKRKRKAVFLVLPAVTVIAVASPVLVSLGLEGKVERHIRSTLITESVRGNPQTLLNILAPSPGRGCTIAAPAELTVSTFSYTGFRHVHLQRGSGGAFVRWKHLSNPELRADHNEILITPSQETTDDWESLANMYDVDALVVSALFADSEVFDPYRKEQALPEGGAEYVVVWRKSCQAD